MSFLVCDQTDDATSTPSGSVTVPQRLDGLTNTIHPRRLFVAVVNVGAMLFALSGVRADDEALRFFENEVRPVLHERCASCHGVSEQAGGLRVDSLQSMLEARETGAAVVPGDLSQSLIIRAVRREGELAMPPDEPLPDREVEVLQRWVEMNAPWPRGIVPTDDEARNHWAFQPVARPVFSAADQSDSAQNLIDLFVKRKLAEKNLSGSAVADRRSLIRRVTYSLTGLPPTFDEVKEFVRNTDPNAYSKVVARLLDSDQYGEHWARQWLDVARYSDTKGYVYAREERFWVHAWSYRDWVVRALNSDMPYDRFLLLQMAADQVEDREPGDLAAMGFLTLGRRFLGVQRDIIDDRIDVVCRGTMGLTVACARCHDHKYDPIPTADYYSLYGVFASCIEQQSALEDACSDETFANELRARQTKLAEQLTIRRNEASKRVRDRIADYLFAQSELHKYPANGFDQIFAKEDLLPSFVRRWEQFLRMAKRHKDPVFNAWHWYAELPIDSFSPAAIETTNRIKSAENNVVHPLVVEAFGKSPKSFREVCDRYGEIFAAVDTEQAKSGGSEQASGAFAENVLLLEILYGPGAPCQVPEGAIMNTETYFDSGACTELWKLQGEVDRWIINANYESSHALALVDRRTPVAPRIFRRGNPLTQGDDVPRQFLSVVAGEERGPFVLGSGRLEMALAIASPQNPLTARVIVNRVWASHFGQGLVATPSVFGTRAGHPSHPELLDWLAAEFVEHGWSLKQLHRMIVLSDTYQQSASGPDDREELATAQQVDPENRLLWRAHRHRLTFEEFRDSLLAATNDLDLTLGGKPYQLFEKPFPFRRSIYGLVDRQYLPGTLRVFDFANPDLHVAKRSETIVPQQALFFMNHPLVLERSKALADSTRDSGSPKKRVVSLFRQTLQRDPSDLEIAEALSLVDSVEVATKAASQYATAKDWQYGYGAVDEETGRIINYNQLPHFTGNEWQGGSKWPDKKLGWLQLTAEGGHPGNDRQHAVVRRWTAPSDMNVRIKSKLKHEPSQGDGIRAFIISSTDGILKATELQSDVVNLDLNFLSVAKGNTIDFVVDIKDVLNSDQYLWDAAVLEIGTSESGRKWHSVTDFPSSQVEPLDGWQQLAQIMLCGNEFMFLD